MFGWLTRRFRRSDDERADGLDGEGIDGSELDFQWPDEPIPDGGIGLTSPFVEGPRVRALQKKLRERGYAVETDGVYDEETAAAVADLKRRLRIAVPEGHDDRASSELLGKLGL